MNTSTLLESVAEFVLSCRSDEEAQMDYLTSHYKWIEVLTEHFGPNNEPEECEDWFDDNVLNDSKRLELTQTLLSNS